jgi:hypothetical protein
MEIGVGVNRGNVLGGERDETSEWDEQRQCSDLMSFKHVIVGVVEGGFDLDLFWARNPPQVAMYPSKNTMVPIAGPLRKINARVVCVPTMKHGRQSDDDL